jgi:anti-anti-sigma factor
MIERPWQGLPAAGGPPVPVDDHRAPTGPRLDRPQPACPPLTVTSSSGSRPGDLVVWAAGEVDLDTAPLLRAALVHAVDRHPVVWCDLSRATFFSAAGVSALVVAHRRAARAGRRLHVRRARGVTLRVLDLTGLDRLLSGP